MSDWEWAAAEVYRRAGVKDGKPRSPEFLARRLGIPIYKLQGMLDRGVLSPVNGGWAMAIRRGQPLAYERHTEAHELGHWICRELGLEETEERCDLIAAAILMPPEAFRERVRQVGHDPRQLALLPYQLDGLYWSSMKTNVITPAGLALPGKMKEKGYNQASLAAALKVSQSAVSAWATLKFRPEFLIRRRMQVLLGLPAEDWETDEEKAFAAADGAALEHTGTEG